MSNQTSNYILTGNNKAIVELLKEGLVAKEIAHKLQLSDRTIENRILAMRHDLGAKNSTELVVICLRRQLVEL